MLAYAEFTNRSNPIKLPTTRVWLSMIVYNESGDPTMITSSKKHWADASGVYMVGAFTAFVSMTDGLPTGIHWEEGMINYSF